MIFTTMFKLLATLIVGYFLYRKNVISDEANKSMSYVVLNIASPCLIAYSIMNMENSGWQEVVKILLIGFVIYLALVIIAYPLAKMLRPKKDELYTYYCMFLFSNCLFMGIPVCSAFLGTTSVFYISIVHVPFNLLFYSLGRMVLSKNSNSPAQKFHLSPSIIINPGFIAVVIGLLFYFTPVSLPSCAMETLSFIGNLCVPLSMLLIGCTIGSYDLKSILKEKKYYLAAAVRLLVIPLILLVICKVMNFDTLVTDVIVLTFGMPVASMVSIGAIEYGGNDKVASSSVALSTILSMVTIPILALILGIS